MIPSVLAAFGSLLLLAPAGTLDVSDGVHVYARHRQAQRPATLDLDNTPRAAAELSWPTTTFTLDYAPQLAWLDVLGSRPSRTLVLHNAELGLMHRQPRYTLRFSQAGSLGEQDFTQLGTNPAQLGTTAPAALTPTTITTTRNTLDVLPSTQVVRVATEDSRLDVHYLWLPRWSSDFDARIGVRGGANAAARVFLPRERDAELGASLDYLLTGRDVLGSGVVGDQISTSNGYSHWLATLQERWSRQLARNSNVELGAGAAFRSSTAPDGSQSKKWSPAGHARVTYDWLLRDVQARFSWETSYAPQVSSVLGSVQGRLQTDAHATLAFAQTSIGVSIEAARTLPSDARDSTRLISTGLVADHELLAWLDLQAGAQIIWQRSNIPSASPQSVWVLYTGLAGHAPELRF